MVAKFRGNSEDWLDDEELEGARNVGARQKKAPSARSTGLPFESGNAVVSEVFPNQCKVKILEDQAEVLCAYRRAEVVGKSKQQSRERTPVAVGDRVLAKRESPTTGVIEGICVRRNCISRPAPGREQGNIQHVLAANLDSVVIVASAQEPEFSPGLVDRFLVASEAEKIPVQICVTKSDLVAPSDARLWDVYKACGYSVFEVSAKQEKGLKDLHAQIEGKTVLFCGHSGVGKTSLLRKLLGAEIGRVSHVNEFTGRGRHTTTGAVLLDGPKTSQWIDTPGVRGFGLNKISPDQLVHYFPEFKNLRCPLPGCMHADESGCQAQSLARYPSYRRILDSLLAGEY